MKSKPLTKAKDKPLFTPGPLTTSLSVKQAMLHDLGSRDDAFVQIVKDIRRKLLAIGNVSEAEYTAILIPGSGTYSVEAVIGTMMPPHGKLLILSNGAYGKRMTQIARVLKIETTTLTFAEDSLTDPQTVEQTLVADPAISHIAVVHCETTTGIFNPIAAIGALAARYGKTYFVDAMSSFGGVPLNLAECHMDYLVSSANKCIEGVPGFGFVLARKAALLDTEGNARSLSLDLFAQWKELESSGQFRFTPPTHALLAFHQALSELEDEEGVAARTARYRANHETLVHGMRKLGFQEYLAPALQGHIITAFRYPTHPHFKFKEFYDRLNDKDFVIYPGKVSHADCFRIGHIGRLFPSDMRALLHAIREVLSEMGVRLGETA